MSRALWLVVLAGCGFQITSGSTAGDGGAADASDSAVEDGDVTMDGAPADAMPDGPLQPTCLLDWLNHTISFGTPEVLANVNTTSFDRDPFVSPDELTLWFSSGNSMSLGGADVFKATRTSKSQPFGSASRDTSFSHAAGAESKMSMTDNALYAVVSSTRPGGAGDSDIWETSRATTSSEWDELSRTHVMQLATSASELDAFVTPSGLQLYFAPVPPAPQRIMVTKRGSMQDNFAMPAEVTELNTLGGNFDPMLIANDRVIVFASDRTAVTTGDNIWYATRSDPNGAFGAPLLLPGVNSNTDDGDPHVSADGCRIYFARNVGGGVDWQLFSASAE